MNEFNDEPLDGITADLSVPMEKWKVHVRVARDFFLPGERGNYNLSDIGDIDRAALAPFVEGLDRWTYEYCPRTDEVVFYRPRR